MSIEERYVKYILDIISDASQKYDTKGEQLLYEQGILIGLLLALIEEDSRNFDIIEKHLESLSKS